MTLTERMDFSPGLASAPVPAGEPGTLYQHLEGRVFTLRRDSSTGEVSRGEVDKSWLLATNGPNPLEGWYDHDGQYLGEEI